MNKWGENDVSDFKKIKDDGKTYIMRRKLENKYEISWGNENGDE